MKRITLILTLTLTIGTAFADNHPEYEPKVQSIDSIIYHLYDVISGPKGEERDWDLMRYIFHPNAKLIPTGQTLNGEILAGSMTVDEYISTSGKWLIDNGFFEVEISREVDEFNSIVQVFSTYETFKTETDENPEARGINSIQLFYDGNRYWIMNVMWSQESEKQPIPEKYLEK